MSRTKNGRKTPTNVPRHQTTVHYLQHYEPISDGLLQSFSRFLPPASVNLLYIASRDINTMHKTKVRLDSLSKVRKGTHSCVECRRRKIKCISDSNTRVCAGCTTRGTRCVPQEYSDAKSRPAGRPRTVRDRADKLEKMVTQILQRLDTAKYVVRTGYPDMSAAEALETLQLGISPSPSGASDERSQSPEGGIAHLQGETVTSIPPHSFDSAPLLSLFDNAVIRQEADTMVDARNETENSSLDAGSRTFQPFFDTGSRIPMAVKALVPNDDDLTQIIRLCLCCWQNWQKYFPNMLVPRTYETETDQITRLRNHIRQCLDSGNVGDTAKILICMAVCFQQLSGRFGHGQWNLPTKPDVLQKRYMAFVETLLASEEGLASTLDGLECMVLQIRFYVDEGKPRKAWLLGRRATGLAYFVGIHRPVRSTTDPLAKRKADLWFQMSLGDRHLSLILGLPYSTLDNDFNRKNFADEEQAGRYGDGLLSKLSVIAGHIIHRNSDLNNASLIDTLKIDQELEEARNSMPPGWWEALPIPGMAANVVRDMFVAKFLYHNDRKLLHLPYLLKSFTDRRYEMSRISGLESSREMIKCYQILRANGALLVCNLIDFEAFTASMVLVLDLLNQHANNRGRRDLIQEDSDWDLVNSIREDFETIGVERISPVAIQAAQVLRQFGDARYGCNEYNTPEAYQVTIPYFGRIRIGKPRMTTPSPSTTSLGSQLLTLGESASEGVELDADPFVSFNNYSFPISDYSYLDVGTDWASMLDLDLQNDWVHPLDGSAMK
ncbi:hypothetical protein MMC26_003551 [Xylographa opegraphella]|nr:hypothetical protein [Xylographa opegraphella]